MMLIDRRTALAMLAAASLSRSATAQPSPERLAVWSGDLPSSGGPTGPIKTDEKGGISNIASPFLEVFTPPKPNGTAVIVAAGGGYTKIEQRHEAYPAARWLNDQGVTAFVLTYRLPREGWRDGPLAPLRDAQRAIRIVRAETAQRQLDPKRIGVMGFSAGGHLLGLAAARSAFASYTARDAIDTQSARPEFAALLYPVVTLERPYEHTSTCRQLIGSDASQKAAAEWSVQTHVRHRCPPMFLAQADDDNISNPANSRLLAAACTVEEVPVEWHRFASGGHGFGMGERGTPTEAWPGMCQSWLRHLGMVG